MAENPSGTGAENYSREPVYLEADASRIVDEIVKLTEERSEAHALWEYGYELIERIHYQRGRPMGDVIAILLERVIRAETELAALKKGGAG